MEVSEKRETCLLLLLLLLLLFINNLKCFANQPSPPPPHLSPGVNVEHKHLPFKAKVTKITTNKASEIPFWTYSPIQIYLIM